ncbi:MAG: leucine-rich repeat protein [Anaerocolumna sp.]
MKKIYISLILALSVFLLLNITWFQAEAKDSNFEIVNGVLIKYSGSDKTVQIPKGVAIIGDYAFKNSGVLKVILPGGIAKIGEGAFDNTALTEINLPDSVTTKLLSPKVSQK